MPRKFEQPAMLTTVDVDDNYLRVIGRVTSVAAGYKAVSSNLLA
jgi:hypothetical protein